MKHLLLMTASFPTGTGETFLNPEIPILAREFDRISIIPMFEKAHADRGLPGNVAVICGYSKMRWGSGRALAVARGMLKGLTRATTWRELMQTLASGPRRPRRFGLRLAEWVRATYRAEMFAEVVLRLQPRPTVCYHYWFTPEALGACYARDRITGGDRIPVVVRAHGGDLYENIQPSHHFAYRSEAMRRIDLLCPVSDFGRDYLARQYPDEAHKIMTQRLGVRGRGISNEQPRSGLTVLSLSNVIAVKRLDRIVAALDLLARELPELPIHWIHAGDGDLMPHLQQEAKRLPSNVRVEFLGRRHNDEVFELLRSVPFDCLLNTSESEGIPVSIMEVFSAGVPAIAPDVGGIGEILGGGGGILLGAVPTPNDIRQALETFIDKQRSAPMRTAAYRTWSDLYQAENNYSAFAARLVEMSPT